MNAEKKLVDIELLPCPFCGKKASYAWKSHKTNFGKKQRITVWHVGCRNKHCMVKPSAYGTIKSDLIGCWNNRVVLSNEKPN